MTINVYKPKKSDAVSHTFSIYSNSQEKLDAGFQYLIEGLENDESILFVTDDLSKEEIIERLQRICQYQYRFNISTLVNDGIITILSSAQWYFSGDMLEMGRLLSSSDLTVSKSLFTIHKDTKIENEDSGESSHFILPMDGKKRFRAFYDMKPFLRRNIMKRCSIMN